MAIDPEEAARLGQEESTDIKEDLTVVLADFFRTAVGKNYVLPYIVEVTDGDHDVVAAMLLEGNGKGGLRTYDLSPGLEVIGRFPFTIRLRDKEGGVVERTVLIRNQEGRVNAL